MSGNKRKIRIAMIGYKFMGKAHSHAYRDVPFFFDLDVEPVLHTLVGRNEDSVKAASEQMGWLHYETDWRKVIRNPDIDVIDIVTPNNNHAEIAIAAAQAGKHVLCEKPLAMNTLQALEMLRAVEDSKVVHMIGHCYRFIPAVQYAKKLIDTGQIGEIRHIRATYLQDWLTDPLFPLTWRLQQEMSGSGASGDLLSHLIDMARFLVGEISEVSAMMNTIIRERPLLGSDNHLDLTAQGKVDLDDAVACLARFSNGAYGVFEATRLALGNRNRNQFEINGSKGSILWDLENLNLLKVYVQKDEPGMQGFRSIHCTEPEHPYIKAYWPPGHSIGYEHAFIHLVYEFLQGISGNYSPSPNFYDGYCNQLVLQAIESSACSNQWSSL